MLIVIFLVIALAIVAIWATATSHWLGDGWPEPPGQDDFLFGQQFQMQQQEFQRQMERDQQLQQEQFDQFSRQSVTPFEQGGFIPNDQFGMPW